MPRFTIRDLLLEKNSQNLPAATRIPARFRAQIAINQIEAQRPPF
jgi:hypothetical protein